MPDDFVIKGGKALAGEIKVQGSKNATLPILAAAILASGTSTLENVPHIRDVENMAKILSGLGAKIDFEKNSLRIDPAGIKSVELDPELVRSLRGSILLAGALLGRFGKVTMPYPGGDAIGSRSIDLHLNIFRELGAEVSETPEHLLEITAPHGLRGKKIILSEQSVTATENAMLAAVLAEGETLISMAATEPHVQELARFLNFMGAKIEGAGTHNILIKGLGGEQKSLMPASHKIIPDTDEAVSLALLAAATRSEIMIAPIISDYMDAALQKMREMGVNFELSEHSLLIKKPTEIYRAAKIQCGLYPKIMSDQLPPFAVLATQAQGTSYIHEWMYEGRFGYINELIKMGASAVILDPHRALIIGPTPLRGAEVKGLDIRAGMTVIIAALVAEGETIIRDASHIDRGFEKIEERLSAIGADICRVVNA